LYSAAISGPQAAAFSVGIDPNNPLPAQIFGRFGPFPILVEFHPVSSGMSTATLTMETDDPYTPAVAVTLTGQAQ
jgi:hypothetical protein